MNALERWVHTPLAAALGWTLLHSLWEGALIAGLLACGLLLSRRTSARFRYALACLALLAMPVAFGITLWISHPHAAERMILANIAPQQFHGNLISSPPRPLGWADRVAWAA